MKNLMLMMTMIALVGCTGAQRDAATEGSIVAGQVTVADRMLQSGVVESTVYSVQMTDDEFATLESAFSTYQDARSELASVVDNPQRAIDAAAMIRSHHQELVQAYSEVQSVVANHWDEYDPVAQARLDRWAGQAQRLEQSYQRMADSVAEARTESARASRIVEMAKIVARIALMAVQP